ncbi:hypothetical protein [Candidatus Soleaferrea massiliensis]|uniref:hypothetical protein n=1 Tax=Candidatus Soleaferrea massiliensis TaxID=1470354 RepID=UPI00058FD332|nr:hypothetical protein [Candidatus Soleaferrea massiliensis]
MCKDRNVCIIGGADGPTAIFVASRPNSESRGRKVLRLLVFIGILSFKLAVWWRILNGRKQKNETASGLKD